MPPTKIINATIHPSGFERSDSNFYSLTMASNRQLYYTLSSHNLETHARAYRHDPETGQTVMVGDFGEIAGETGKKMLPQGKSHTPFFEHQGKLYVATHYGYFQASGDKEMPAAVPPGYHPYPGGHFLEIDLATGAAKNLATAPKEEGIITMGSDFQRGRLYGLTWPKGFFIYYDMASGTLRNLGPVSRDGEVGTGDQYFCLCRTFAVFPDDGSVFFTNADGEILRYAYDKDRIESIPWAHIKKTCSAPGTRIAPGIRDTTGGRANGIRSTMCSTACTPSPATCSGSTPRTKSWRSSTA